MQWCFPSGNGVNADRITDRNNKLDVLLTVHHATSMNPHQLDKLSLLYFIKSQCLYMFRTLIAHLQEAVHVDRNNKYVKAR
jgi:hypothetical protein